MSVQRAGTNATNAAAVAAINELAGEVERRQGSPTSNLLTANKPGYLNNSSSVVRDQNGNKVTVNQGPQPILRPIEPVIRPSITEYRPTPSYIDYRPPSPTFVDYRPAPSIVEHRPTVTNVLPTYSHNYGYPQSDIERQIIAAREPLHHLSNNQYVTSGPYRGIYLNKHEVDSWRGQLPIEQYPLHNDPNPEVIRKRLDKVRYVQELGVRYLNPGPAPKPGDLIIRERATSLPPAPPLIVRQEGSQPHTPPPAIYREAPPLPPPRVPEEVIDVPGGPASISPRRVIIERLSNLPARPQDIIVEKWLPYQRQRRRIIHQRAATVAPVIPRNLIIEWEAPDVEVVQQCRDLGVRNEDPEEYRRRYGPELKQSHELPTCNGRHHHVHEVRQPVQVIAAPPPPVYVPPPVVVPAPVVLQAPTVTATTTGCPVHYGTNYHLAHSHRGLYDGYEWEGDIEALRLLGDRYQRSANLATLSTVL